MNLLKYLLAKARRRKRIDTIKKSLEGLSEIANKKRLKLEGLASEQNIIIASTTQGNERIAAIDYKIKCMLDEKNIKNQLIFCSGGLTACSMREVEKVDLRIHKEANKINYACISCSLRLNSTEILPEKMDKEQVIYMNYWDAYMEATRRSGVLSKARYKDIDIHEHAKSSLVRYLGRPLKKGEEIINQSMREMYESYLKSACAVAEQWDTLISKVKPSRIILNHGLYVPQGIILEVAKKYKIPVSTWHLGYRRNTLLIAHGDTYHKTLIEPVDENYLNLPLERDKANILREYMLSRRTGENDQISFVYKDGKSKNTILNSIKSATYGKVNFLVPTNVSWDAQSHFKLNAYTSMEEWINDVIRVAGKFSEKANFIFRCHPAEVTGKRKSRYSSSEYIRKRIKRCKNIFIIRPDEQVSTYDLIDHCDAGIIYASKVGIEIAYSGKELIVCGEACIRSKGIAREVDNKTDLEAYINQIISGDKRINKQKAAKYAYHIFFEEMTRWNRLESNQNREDDELITKRLLQL